MMNNRNNNPLVSIIVITYNSAKYVLETIESAKAQTYENIELIITDDSSSDATIDLCRMWLEENSARFSRTQLITVEKNTGIPANCNRGVKASTGEWVKLIAGDDILLQNCISDNINFYLKNATSNFIVSKMVSFIDGELPRIFSDPVLPRKSIITAKTAQNQYRLLLIGYIGNTPTLFIKKEILDKLQFDESHSFMEDYPFVLNVVKTGYKIDFLDHVTVAYRLRNNSAFNYDNEKIYNDFFIKMKNFNEKYRYPYISKALLNYEKSENKRKLFMIKYGLNKRRRINLFIASVSFRLNPYQFFLNKDERNNI